jgi:hypothetical protein
MPDEPVGRTGRFLAPGVVRAARQRTKKISVRVSISVEPVRRSFGGVRIVRPSRFPT